jgi:hypothetical protein
MEKARHGGRAGLTDLFITQARAAPRLPLQSTQGRHTVQNAHACQYRPYAVRDGGCTGCPDYAAEKPIG